jgi:NADH-quinone oxidoreductase subunit E
MAPGHGERRRVAEKGAEKGTVPIIAPDNLFTVLTVACLGACSIAPVIKVDGEFYGHLTVERLDQLLDEVAGQGGDR